MIKMLDYKGPSYKTLVSFGSWRAAKLNYSPDQKPGNIPYLERHTETDEVFILQKGFAWIMDGGSGKKPLKALKKIPMKPGVFYNIKKMHWHYTVMKPGSSILIMENRDTGSKNSDHFPLSDNDRLYLQKLFKKTY